MKEPYAFRKIRQKLELRQVIHAGSKGGVVGSESVLITPKELEFIPLEAPLGKDSEQGGSMCVWFATCQGRLLQTLHSN